MKYFFTLLFVLASFISFSQDDPSYYNCYKSVRGEWNTYTNKWDYADPKISSITFKVYKNIITADDEAQSRYETYGNGEELKTEEYTQKSWTALDEKSRKVKFAIVAYKESGDNVFMVFYDKLVYVYFVNKSGLSPIY